MRGIRGWVGGSREICVDECLMSQNGLLCDPAAEGQVGFTGSYRLTSADRILKSLFIYIYLDLFLPKMLFPIQKVEDQCLFVPNVHSLQSLILKTGFSVSKHS